MDDRDRVKGDAESIRAADSAFVATVAQIYERDNYALLFEPYARDIAGRLEPLETGTILETAAGTGAVTRELVRRQPETVQIVATDLNQAMLDVAATKIDARNVRFQIADAQQLPFPEGAFDAVLCQFGVMFFPDKLGAFREAARVLKPGRRFLFNVWDDIKRNEICNVVSNELARVFPEDPPQFLKRGPFGYSDAAAIAEVLASAGFTKIEHQTVEAIGTTRSAEDAARGLCEGSPLRAELFAHGEGRARDAIASVGAAIRRRFGDGPIQTELSAHVFSALKDRSR